MEVGIPSGKEAYELCIPGVSAAVGGSRRVATPVRNACLENDKGLPVPAALETPGSGSASASEAKASEALEVEIATELEALTDFEWQLQQLHDLEHEERQLQEEWKLLEEIDMAEKELAQLRISDPEEAVDATAQTSAELTKAAVLPQEAVMHAKVNDQVVSYLFGELICPYDVMHAVGHSSSFCDFHLSKIQARYTLTTKVWTLWILCQCGRLLMIFLALNQRKRYVYLPPRKSLMLW